MFSREKPSLAADVVVALGGGVVLVKRAKEPYRGSWALPGGFVRHGERVEDAALREVLEETGLRIKLKRLVGVYSDPKRDPRGHVVSVCFLGEKVGGELRAATDAAEARIFKEIPWEGLAFDHAQMLRDTGGG
jgi:8-oxo-dGTP diphosphatase